MTQLSINKQVWVWCRRMGLHDVPTDFRDIVEDFMRTYKPYTKSDFRIEKSKQYKERLQAIKDLPFGGEKIRNK